jgi:hypothetical protein
MRCSTPGDAYPDKGVKRTIAKMKQHIAVRKIGSSELSGTDLSTNIDDA